MLTFSCLLILSTTTTFAGGSTITTTTTERAWKYEDQSLATFGTFLKTKNGRVFIQTTDEVVSLTIQSLYWGDKQYIQQHEQDVNIDSTSYEENEGSSIFPFLAYNLLSLVGMGLFLIWRFRLKAKVVYQ